MYIMSVSKNVEIPELKNYRFKGVEIFPVETDDFCELNIYLLDNDLKDIFSLFIQNILEDIAESVTENEAVTKTLNVISKWKKLFDKINFNGLSIEQQKGLIGELLFINYLLDLQKSSSTILNAWTGPDFEDKDFVFGGTGIEIKLTSSKYPKIKISNDTVKGSPTIREVLPTIAEKIKGKILVASNVKFCLAFLDNALLNNGFSALDNPTIDTYSVDIRMFPETHLHNLWHVMQHLGIAFDSEELDEVKYETKILFNILDRVQKENPKLTLNEFEDWTTSKGE